MKIAAVTASIVSIPRRRALKTAYGISPDTRTVVVKMQTDEGVIGWGQTVAPAPWGGDSAEAIKLQIDRYLVPALIGEDPFNIERLHQRMNEALRGAKNAVTALDFALWDIKGLALDVPVCQLLGGRVNRGAVLHAFVEREEPAAMAARIDELAAAGWRWFKTKIGFGVAEDLLWYSRLRELVDADIVFQLDGNTGYTLGAAVQACTQIERMGGVALFEQLVRYLDEMAALARRVETPLQADELTADARSVYEIARGGAAQVLHFKLHRYGGLLPAARMAAVAEAAGLEISVAPYFDIIAAAAAHFAAATPVATWPAGFSDMTDSILAEAYEPEGNILKPPTRAGLGIIIDEDKLAHYANKQ